jgi:hypothetical protein
MTQGRRVGSVANNGVIEGAGRSDPPSSWKHAKCHYELAWHHVIPCRTLRDCWNQTVLSAGRLGWDEVPAFLRLVGAGDDDSIIEKMKQRKLGVPSAWESDALFQKLKWPAWNLVEGPRFRVDDPGETFERFIYGMSGNELDRQFALRRLNTAMIQFAGSPSDSRARQLLSELNYMRLKYGRSSWIPFKPSMWVQATEGHPGRKGPLIAIQPKWRKARPGG